MQVGIIGLPNAGKSTIFNLLTNSGAAVASYPFCTIEPNTGFVNVPDNNLFDLSKIYNSAKITNASIRVTDVAGLVKGASKGEGLGNKFLANIREVDAIAHIVRCFYDEDVPHPSGKLDPGNDIEIINTELMLADIETLARWREKFAVAVKSGDEAAKKNIEVINYLADNLNKGIIPDVSDIYNNNLQLFLNLNLLVLKPVIFVANLGEDRNSFYLLERLAAGTDAESIIKIYGKIENELLELKEEERDIYRKELGIEAGGLKEFIKKCYRMLDLITFYTINKNETRAWPLKRNSRVIEAAGKIHTDMKKGFIKAEVISSSELLRAGSIAGAREEGKLRIEGRDYIVEDADVIQIRFSV